MVYGGYNWYNYRFSYRVYTPRFTFHVNGVPRLWGPWAGDTLKIWISFSRNSQPQNIGRFKYMVRPPSYKFVFNPIQL